MEPGFRFGCASKVQPLPSVGAPQLPAAPGCSRLGQHPGDPVGLRRWASGQKALLPPHPRRRAAIVALGGMGPPLPPRQAAHGYPRQGSAQGPPCDLPKQDPVTSQPAAKEQAQLVSSSKCLFPLSCEHRKMKGMIRIWGWGGQPGKFCSVGGTRQEGGVREFSNQVQRRRKSSVPGRLGEAVGGRGGRGRPGCGGVGGLKPPGSLAPMGCRGSSLGRQLPVRLWSWPVLDQATGPPGLPSLPAGAPVPALLLGLVMGKKRGGGVICILSRGPVSSLGDTGGLLGCHSQGRCQTSPAVPRTSPDSRLHPSPSSASAGNRPSACHGQCRLCGSGPAGAQGRWGGGRGCPGQGSVPLHSGSGCHRRLLVERLPSSDVPGRVSLTEASTMARAAWGPRGQAGQAGAGQRRHRGQVRPRPRVGRAGAGSAAAWWCRPPPGTLATPRLGLRALQKHSLPAAAIQGSR
ncbi:collagen alpha-1(I) chain-like [Canis lupus dingo]|uniref:collagen alpha-1(I) chain-like n=1 Tax=Canis lupus dingo TaxID=286419 RepID=UPI000DC74806|nr:collagen alpha-1(I) chain-like [Canis lupus dingo]